MKKQGWNLCVLITLSSLCMTVTALRGQYSGEVDISVPEPHHITHIDNSFLDEHDDLSAQSTHILKEGCKNLVNVHPNLHGPRDDYKHHPVEKSWVTQYNPKGIGYTHMAMITVLPNGTALTAWQASHLKEGDSDQHIRVTTSYDPLSHDIPLLWKPSFKVPAVGGRAGAVWGPILHLPPEDPATVWLFYSESHGRCSGGPMEWAPGGDIKYVTLDLEANAWSEPTTLLEMDEGRGIPKVTANKVAVLSSGEWVLPFWRERALLNQKNKWCGELKGKQSAGVLRSADGGETWEAHGALTHPGTWLIENAIVELKNQTILMVFRTRIGHIYAARSDDTGLHWDEATPLGSPAMPNPNAKIDIIALKPSGALALVFNDHQKPPGLEEMPQCKKCRTHLTVAVSIDDGDTWRRIAVMDDLVGASLRIHYPTLQQHGCDLLVAYSIFYSKHLTAHDPSYDQQGIRVARLPLDGSVTL